MSTVSIKNEPRLSLLSASWETYIALRDDPENLRIRMTFDQDQLELMSPSGMHERLGYLLGRLIDQWTLEYRIRVQSLRSTTFRRTDLKKGVEPDNCYYLANESVVRYRDDVDLAIDPPPDLAIEIDVSSSSLSRMGIYAALGVSEVWRWSDECLQVMKLHADGEYHLVNSSDALPDFPIQAANDLLRRRGELDETSLVETFRNQIQQSRTDT